MEPLYDKFKAELEKLDRAADDGTLSGPSLISRAFVLGMQFAEALAAAKRLAKIKAKVAAIEKASAHATSGVG